MCLAVPMKIISLEPGDRGVVESDGVRYDTDLMLIEEPRIGDYVIVHAGYAIEKLKIEEAEERIELFRRMAALIKTRPLP